MWCSYCLDTYMHGLLKGHHFHYFWTNALRRSVVERQPQWLDPAFALLHRWVPDRGGHMELLHVSASVQDPKTHWSMTIVLRGLSLPSTRATRPRISILRQPDLYPRI